MRYWYDTHPTLEKMARDRASRVEPEAINSEIIRIVRDAEKTSASGFASVYICPNSSVEVPDDALSLVILPPSKPLGKDIEHPVRACSPRTA